MESVHVALPPKSNWFLLDRKLCAILCDSDLDLKGIFYLLLLFLLLRPPSIIPMRRTELIHKPVVFIYDVSPISIIQSHFNLN